MSQRWFIEFICTRILNLKSFISEHENSCQKRGKVIVSKHWHICLFLNTFLLIHKNLPLCIRLNPQGFQVILDLLPAHFWASSTSIQPVPKMRKQFVSVFTGQFYQLYPPLSLVLFSFYHYLCLNFYLGLSLHMFLWYLVTELCSYRFHANFLRTFGIELGDLLLFLLFLELFGCISLHEPL